MPALGTYARNKIRDVSDNSTWTGFSTLHLALYTTPTGPGSEGTEVSGSNYARVALAPSVLVSNGNGILTTNAAVETAVASGSWGTVTHVALHDASTAGNRIAWGALAAGLPVVNTQKIRFEAGAIILDVSGV
jgi:hypothetical protein